MQNKSERRTLRGLTQNKLQEAILLLRDSFVELQMVYGTPRGIIYMELYEPHTEEELSVYTTTNGEFFDIHLVISGDAGDDEAELGAVLEDFILGHGNE